MTLDQALWLIVSAIVLGSPVAVVLYELGRRMFRQ